MVKIFGSINFALGFATLSIFAIWCKGDVFSNFGSSSIILLMAGSITLLAAGLSVKRISILFHGWAATAYICWAIFATLNKAQTGAEISGISEYLQSLFSVFSTENNIYPAFLLGFGFSSTFIGTWIDKKGGIELLFNATTEKVQKQRTMANSAPSTPKSEPTPKSVSTINATIDPNLKFDNNPAKYTDEATPVIKHTNNKAKSNTSVKKIIRCSGCNTKIKIKSDQANVRCPACKAVTSI